MDEGEARRRFAAARVAVLSTVDGGQPHLVPVVFAVTGGILYTALDAKPKRGGRLRRHANIAANPRVALLAHDWHEDWSRLWWVRVDGLAVVTDEVATVTLAVELLRAKYPQYDGVGVAGPVIEVAIEACRGWSAQPV